MLSVLWFTGQSWTAGAERRQRSAGQCLPPCICIPPLLNKAPPLIRDSPSLCTVPARRLLICVAWRLETLYRAEFNPFLSLQGAQGPPGLPGRVVRNL